MEQGQVSKVISRQSNGKTFYSVALVNGGLFGFGLRNPGVQEGDLVSFEATKNARGYMDGDINTLKVTKPEPVQVAQAASAASVGAAPAAVVAHATPSSYLSKDAYWSNKEKRDVENDGLRTLGASRNTAIEWVKFLVQVEALPLSKVASKREEALCTILDDYTSKFMSGIAPEPSGTVDTLTIEDGEVTEIVKKGPGRPKKEAAVVAPNGVGASELPWN